MAKIHPSGVNGAQFGTTYCTPEPAKFPNSGPGQKKKGSGSASIMSGPHGMTYLANESHISVPNAARGAKSSKALSSSKGAVSIKNHETAGDMSASKSGSEGPAARAYPLARDYDKSGKGSSKSQSFRKA